ncbi:MAG: AraC family ligand binding domain-containing protein [Acetobacter sp.]|nr:AraC family ligand binding domain-containing protein [Bacteroides sp.]MCM1340178.1 AraC family ligand binding domain-containing protein [Acetobacter sp.]MCM1432870.1 AraC family ligand binding domain-containing protein [Clostridiales bacterium]
MISFEWNSIKFNIADIGGGRLEEEIARHSHSKNSYELHFITGGIGTLITDDGEYSLKKGDFFVTGPNLYHSQKSDLTNPIEDIFIYIQKIEGRTDNIFASEFLNKVFYIAEDFDYTSAQEMLSEYRQKRPDYKSAVAGLAMKILTQIVRCYIPDNVIDSVDSDNLCEKRFIIIENAFLYNKNITLTQLSEKIGVCPRQTQRLLKQYYGKSFRQKKKEQKQ